MSELTTSARDAEISLLGAVMLGADLDDIAHLVDPADFYDPFHGEVWSAMLRVHRAGDKPDVVKVRVALDQSGTKNDPVRLFEFAEKCPAPSAGEFYATEVATAAGMRNLVNAGLKIQQLGNSPGDLEERREQARTTVDNACQGKHVSRARTIASVLPEVIDTAQHGQQSTLSTPWADLDKFTGGIAPGRLVVIGARPGVGKSLMCTNLALHVAGRHGHGVLIASMEMPEVEVGQRLLAAHARVNLSALHKGNLTDGDWDRIRVKHEALMAMPIVIDDSPEQSVATIRKAARDIQRTRDDLALICVDYLQLMRTGGQENRAEALGEVSRGLKLIARETGACVVAAAQLNRQAVGRVDRPRMSDLRESGAIEADADQVILLHQPEDDIPEIEAIVDKNRHGPRGVGRLEVWGHYARLQGIGPQEAVSA